MGLKESIGAFFGRQKQATRYEKHDRSREYFFALKDLYPGINRICYGGVGDDYETFAGLERDLHVITLDHESGFSTYLRERSEFPNYVTADFSSMPFKDGVFDVVFIQDADSVSYGDMFRTLKTGGLFVFSSIDCGILFNLTHTDFDKIDNLKRIELPDQHIAYSAFEKIGPVSQQDLDRIDKEHVAF